MADLSAGNRHSRISGLLPEPLTQVTRTSRPRGNLTVRSWRLFFFAPLSVSHPPCPSAAGFRLWTLDFGLWTSLRTTGLRFPRVGKVRCARRHFPVTDSGRSEEHTSELQ